MLSLNEKGVEVLLRGRLFLIDIEDERQRRLRETTSIELNLEGEFTLAAPMPGMVVAVPVEVGQSVEKGDNLIILESMKMQNELKAPRDGEVSGIRVGPGDSVDQNQASSDACHDTAKFTGTFKSQLHRVDLHVG